MVPRVPFVGEEINQGKAKTVRVAMVRSMMAGKGFSTRPSDAVKAGVAQGAEDSLPAASGTTTVVLVVTVLTAIFASQF